MFYNEHKAQWEKNLTQSDEKNNLFEIFVKDTGCEELVFTSHRLKLFCERIFERVEKT